MDSHQLGKDEYVMDEIPDLPNAPFAETPKLETQVDEFGEEFAEGQIEDFDNEIIEDSGGTGSGPNGTQSFAEKMNYSVVRDFCGHGLGEVFHDQPSILHVGSPGEGVQLKEGMFFTVEPMINVGDYKVKVLSDGWTAVTSDKSLSAQFEHSVGVTKNGYEIFTLSSKKFYCPPYI